MDATPHNFPPLTEEAPPDGFGHNQEGPSLMTTTEESRTNKPWKKIAATSAILLGAGALITTGAFAVFTDSGTATTTIDAGQLDIVMSENITVADIAPGDTVQRPLDITLPNATNDGDLVSLVRFYYDVTQDTAGTNDPALAGEGESLVDGADGLTFQLQTCVGGTWAATAGDVGPYTCSTGDVTNTTDVVKLSALEGLAVADDLTPADFGVAPTTDGTFPSDAGDVTLSTLATFVLPTAADNDYENAATSLTFTAAAIQRDGIQQ